jgi:hypothetical protein
MIRLVVIGAPPFCRAVCSRRSTAGQLKHVYERSIGYRSEYHNQPQDGVALLVIHQWYRYHLFAEVLAAQLRVEQPELVPTLHQRA